MKRYALVVIIGLLGLGLTVGAQENPAPPAKPKPAPQAPLAKIKEALKITPEQEVKLKSFREARQNENKAFAEQMKKLRGDLQALRQDPKSDPNKVNGLIDQFYKFQADRAKGRLKSGQEWTKLFSQEQLDIMKKGRNRGMGMGMGRGRDMMGRGQMRGQGRSMVPPGQMMGRGQRPGLGQRIMGPGMGQMGFGQRGRGQMAPLYRMLMRRWMNRLPGQGWGWGWNRE